MSVSRLQDLFCQHFGCAQEEYEERAFRQCLYWHARFLAPLLRLVNPTLFDNDRKFIRYLGAATDWQEAKTDVNNFYVLNEGKPGFWRETLRLRVSGRKATKLARQLLVGLPSAAERSGA